jgi:hypothetical protein
MASGLYDQDFLLWTEREAALLRTEADRSNGPVDWLHVAEEVESLGRSQVTEARCRLARIVEHLLKLEFSPAPEPRRGWTETILSQRRDLARLLRDSPSLRARLPDLLAEEQPEAVQAAAEALEARGETAAAQAVRERGGAYTLRQVMEGWFPT